MARRKSRSSPNRGYEIGEARHARTSPSLAGALRGGIAGSAILLVSNQLVRQCGWTDLDLPRVLGLTFRNPEQDGTRLLGSAWYFTTGGLSVPLLYWAAMRPTGRAGATPGLMLGLVHYLLSGLMLAATHPPRPKQARGAGRPMGPFLSNYGLLEWITSLLGHAGYGVLVGLAAHTTPAS